MSKRKTPLRGIFNAGWYGGVLLFTGMYGLIQDYFGLDGWIEFISSHWSPAWITVPSSLAFIIMALLLMSYGLHQSNPKRFQLTPMDVHPEAGRFCHICGADRLKDELCNAETHS